MPNTITAPTRRYIPALFADGRAQCLAAWPEVDGIVKPIYEVSHIHQLPWGKIQFPSAVIHMERFTRSHEWGAGNVAHTVDVHFYYLADTDGPADLFADRMEAMREVIEGRAPIENDLFCIQTLSVGDFSWDDSIPVNRMFVQREDTQRAAMITANMLCWYPFQQ